jgi:hypothetical protein
MPWISLAVIGWLGYNSRLRVWPALSPLTGTMETVGYDLRLPEERTPGIRWVSVRDKADLERRLREQRPTHVLIETTDADHPAHIDLALRAGPGPPQFRPRVGLLQPS